MGVESLPRGIDGMLFSYSSARPAAYHMLETTIPLDIWWFDDQGRLVGSAEMTPCPAEPCAVYGSPGPVSWVLETPLGGFDLEVGDLLVVQPRG